jgi:hypothetical protein
MSYFGNHNTKSRHCIVLLVRILTDILSIYSGESVVVPGSHDSYEDLSTNRGVCTDIAQAV